MVDLQLHGVDAHLFGRDLGCGVHIELRQRINGLANLRLDQPAHLHHLAGDMGQLGVKLGG